MATLAASGMGLACLPRFLGDATPALRVLVTPVAEPERQLFLALHRDTRAVPRIKLTASMLKEGIRRLHPALCPGAS